MATQKTQRVEVDRPFYHKGDILGIGSVADFPAPVAAELRSARKVHFVQSDTKLKTTSEVPEPPDAAPPDEKEPAKKSSGKGGSK